jgi:spermidine synthase
MRDVARSLRDVSPQRRIELERRAAQPFSVTALMKGSRRQPAKHASSASNPRVVDTSTERQLQFKDSVLQSRMRLDDPYLLVAPYTRQMMSFLLFNPDPVHILMIGLGGGSMPKFCHRHLPTARVTVVELDARVIAMRESFCIPADDERLRIVHADGVHYVARLDQPVDVVLIDAFDEDGVAPLLATSNFFVDVAKHLSDDGVLIMNLLGEPLTYAAHLRRVRDLFGNRVVLVAVQGNDNVLLFAFKPDVIAASAPRLTLRARHLQSKYRMNFRAYLQRIREGASFPDGEA